jgi:CO/xanthine dehydrogenase Mo-binding subunit
MRTPGQFQQNFPRELAISEAAALAGADPIQFRIDHTPEPRFKEILTRLRNESGWKTRAAPAAQSKRSSVLRGQAPQTHSVEAGVRKGGARRLIARTYPTL